MLTIHSYLVTPQRTSIQLSIASVGKHYEVTLDRHATSFLGLNLTHNSDGTLTITQPKLLLKIFDLYPPQKESMHKPTHSAPKGIWPITTARRHLRIPVSTRYSPLPGQEPTGHHGRGIIFGYQEQQPYLSDRPLLRGRIPPGNAGHEIHPPYVYHVCITIVLWSQRVLLTLPWQ